MRKNSGNYSVGEQSLGTFEDLLKEKKEELSKKVVVPVPESAKAPGPGKTPEPAKEEKAVPTAPVVVKISEIGVGFEVKKLMDEEIAAAVVAGKQFAEDAKKLACQELDIEAELRKLQPELRKLQREAPKGTTLEKDNPLSLETARLEGRLKVLRNVDPKQRVNVEDAKLHEEVVRTQRLHPTRAMMNRLMDLGFIRVATFEEVQTGKAKGWPENAQFFEGKTAFPCERNDKTPRYISALNAEIRKMTKRAVPNEVEYMKATGQADFTGLREGNPGDYFVSYSGWGAEDKATGNIKKHGPGCALIRIFFHNREKVLKVEVAVGDCRWWEAEKGQLELIPIEWYEKGRVLDRKMSREEYDVRRIEAILRVVMYNARKQVEDKHLDQLVNKACGINEDSSVPVRIIEVPLPDSATEVSKEPEKVAVPEAPVLEPEPSPITGKGKKANKKPASK